MRGKPHKQQQQRTTATPAPQHLLLRTLVGSFVVCAALGATNAPARACGQYADIALVRASAAFQSQAHALRRAVHVRAASVVKSRADQVDSICAASLSNLTASASGKQLSPQPGMSREMAGNLLRQSLALP